MPIQGQEVLPPVRSKKLCNSSHDTSGAVILYEVLGIASCSDPLVVPCYYYAVVLLVVSVVIIDMYIYLMYVCTGVARHCSI